MKLSLTLFIIFIGLSSCFRSDELLETHTSVFDKDYSGESPFAIYDEQYYTYSLVDSDGNIVNYYRIKFKIEVNMTMLPEDHIPNVKCDGALSIIRLTNNPDKINVFEVNKQVPPGGGTYCQNIYLLDTLGYAGKKFNHCVTATG